MSNRLILLVSFFLIGVQSLKSQSVTIGSIRVEGNVKTKDYIILRELPFHQGEVVAKDSLQEYYKIAEHQLTNTSLFMEAKVTAQMLDSNKADIVVQVKERWYLFPLPYFRWVDRNFSEWMHNSHFSLSRVNYGVNFRQSNFTGNNDKLVVSLITGYTHQVALRYQFPYIDKSLKWGVGAGLQYYTQKEVNYNTGDNKQLFYSSNNVLREGFRFNVNSSFRKNLFERHIFQVGVGQEKVPDTVLLLNSHLLPTLNGKMNYFDISYNYIKSKFDYNAYPKKGNGTEVGIMQRFALNAMLTSFQFRKTKAQPINENNFLYFESNSLLKILPNQNYTDLRLMGYGNMQMSGLEYYVIDGNAGSLLKASWHHSLGSFTVKNIVAKKILPEVTYHFWLKAFVNTGYVYSEKALNQNKLNNTLLKTAGLGLDIISIYDFVFKIDYSINQLGQKGIYLHGGINF